MLQAPLHRFEVWEGEDSSDKPELAGVPDELIANSGVTVAREVRKGGVVGVLILPNDLFGVPIRKDIVHRAYTHQEKLLRGYSDEMQLHYGEIAGP